MAVIEKVYALHPTILWNAVADIVEMRKGKTTKADDDSMTLVTEMYGIKTEYLFRFIRGFAGTTVIVETDGESENDRRRVELMFATIDNIVAPFAEQQETRPDGE